MSGPELRTACPSRTTVTRVSGQNLAVDPEIFRREVDACFRAAKSVPGNPDSGRAELSISGLFQGRAGRHSGYRN